jgi:hypothetical protein
MDNVQYLLDKVFESLDKDISLQAKLDLKLGLSLAKRLLPIIMANMLAHLQGTLLGPINTFAARISALEKTSSLHNMAKYQNLCFI